MSFLPWPARAFGAASLMFIGVAVASSCGSADAPADDGLLFQGEGKLLEGFTFNTGPQPSSGPASVSLRLSGTGTVKVEARGAVDGGKLAGRTGTGRVDIDAHVKLDGTLRIDSTFKKSTGDIPGLKDVDIAIVGTVAFDPFLLEGTSADVVAAIPETQLPDVPLGSVPGKLRLKVVSGSQLTSKYTGSCMTIASGAARYEGSAVTSGTLVIKGTIVLELPSPLDKEVDLPEITVPIPNGTSPVVFASVATAGATDETSRSCSTATGDGGMDDGGTDGGGTDGAATDTTVTTDTGVKPDTGSTGDTGSTDADTAPPTCANESNEPDFPSDTAHALSGINDCDGSESQYTGLLSSASDVDVVRFDGEDTFGCAVNPYAKVTAGPVTLCMKAVCLGGTTEFQGCAKGTKTAAGECCGTEVESDFGCAGTSKDSARVYLTVRPTGSSIPTCSSYSVKYHY